MTALCALLKTKFKERIPFAKAISSRGTEMHMKPLADRIRPVSFEEMVGQTHLFGEKGALRQMLRAGYLPNLIFYGPPGTGKTTAANLIAASSDKTLYKLNATTATLSDVKEIAAETRSMFGQGGILLYLDEIQYFNKKQQQSLLEYMEDGRITLIASTTENPYFCIYQAVLSRSSVMEFKPVKSLEMLPALHRAWDVLTRDAGRDVKIDEKMLLKLAEMGGGDVRRAIGLLEQLFFCSDDAVTEEDLRTFVPRGSGLFDRDGDTHYDLLSAFQKSVRGSDPDAAIFYLARILEGGDLLSACRRLLVIASEDVGLAYPLAVSVTQACVAAARELGLPEARIPLANATILLATSPKSNSALMAYEKAAEDVRNGKGQRVPSHLQDSHYTGVAALERGSGYLYPHAYPGHYIGQQYLPDDLTSAVYYHPADNKTEQTARSYAQILKKTEKESKP